MTLSDLFLLLGGALLAPGIATLRFRSPVQRGLVWAVVLVVIGGLFGTIAAEETQLSLLNLARLAIAAGVTLVVFVLWSPSAAELRRFLLLVVLSGLGTAIWALTHAEANLGRPSGLSDHPNHLALVLLIAIGPAVAYSLVRSSRRFSRIAAGGASGVLAGAIIVSGSRAGLLGLAVAGTVTAVLLRDVATRVRLCVVAATIIVASIVGFSGLTTENAVSRAFGAQSRSAAASDEARHVQFTQMIDQIQENPITGVGFSDPLGGHDAFLQLWAAGGIAAFLGGLVVIGSVGSAAIMLRKSSSPRTVDDESFPLLATTISLSALLAALAFQNGLWNRYIWVTIALVAASSAIVGPERPERTVGLR